MNHTNQPALFCNAASARVLALDLATTTGHALLSAGIITSGSQFFGHRVRKNHPAPPAGAQFAMFENWLKERIRDDKPAAIAYEEVFRWMSSSAAHVFCAFRGIMLKEALRAGIHCTGYSPTTIKKHWTGSGAAKKEAMMAETVRRYPDLDLTDNNEADALAILSLHLSTLKPATS